MSLRADRRGARQSQRFATERLPRSYGLAMTNSLRSLSPLWQKGIEMKIKRKQLKKECTAGIDRQRKEIPESMCDDIYLARLFGGDNDSLSLRAKRGSLNRLKGLLHPSGSQ